MLDASSRSVSAQTSGCPPRAAWFARGRALPWTVALTTLITSCGPVFVPVGPDAPPPVPPLDFARALELGNMAFDVTSNRTISVEELRARYGVNGVEATVFATVLPGDDGESRFMLLTDDAARHQTLVLAGTNTQIQWKFDAATEPAYQADLGASVHVGWNTFSFGIYNTVLPELRSDYSLTVTGFSLGAALSCIVSEYLTLAGYGVDEIVTFGQPRITDTAGTAVFDNLPITRYVNDGDPFPHMKADGSAAAHFGRMVLLYDGPYYAYVADGDPRLQAEARPFESYSDEEFNYHAEDLYRARLTEKLSDPVRVEYQP